VIVTVVPLLTVEPPAGRWSRTTPSWRLSVTALVFSATVKPAAISALIAARALSPVTFGTVAAVGVVAVVVGVEVVGVVVELVGVDGVVVVVDGVVVVSVFVVGVVAVLVTRTNDTSTVWAAPLCSYDAAVPLEPPEEPVEPAVELPAEPVAPPSVVELVAGPPTLSPTVSTRRAPGRKTTDPRSSWPVWSSP
jgi:hypothetical protein